MTGPGRPGPDRPAPTVAVIGLGYVGASLAATLADRGSQVVGVDTDPELVAGLAAGRCWLPEPGLADLLGRGLAAGRLRVTTDYPVVREADVVLIAVGTPVRPDGSLVDTALRAASRELGAQLRAGQLVVLKSTVPPGTTRRLVLPELERGGLVAGSQFGLGYSPERLAEGTALRDLRTIPVVVGGLDPESTRDLAQFWRRALGVEVLAVDSLESAELVKLADNWWIDLNIALANELAKLCSAYRVDVRQVIAAANTVPKGQGQVNILAPGVGVGGACLTKDPWMVWWAARQRGVEIRTAPVGRQVNDGMPGYTAALILAELAGLGRDPASATVAVLGLAYKDNTGDLRATPVRGVVAALTAAGARVRLHDPRVDPDRAEALFGIRPAGTVAAAVRDADCVAVLALHREFEQLDFGALPVAAPCLLLDGRAVYSQEQIEALRRSGYVYRGIGR